MSEIIIFNFKDPRVQIGDFVSQVSEIFFESSTKKEFKNKAERDAFEWKYLGFYLSHYPEYAWIAVKGEKVLGYVLGMPFSQDPSLYQIQPHMIAFEDYFELYPAHLHINCHADSRGQGVGKLLVLKLLNQLKNEGVSGLHIMTGSQSENRFFYQKLGFDFEAQDGSILLQGIRL